VSTVQMPKRITVEMINALRDNPTTSVDDKDEFHKRIGWLVCAYDVLVDMASYASVSVKELEIDVRSMNCLLAEKILHIGQLERMTVNDLLRVPNVGRKSAQLIITARDAHLAKNAAYVETNTPD